MKVDTFLAYLEHEKRYSSHTITAYAGDLAQFLNFIEEVGGLDSVAEADHWQVRSWVVDQLSRDVSPRTVNRKLSTLKTYFKFLLKRGDIGHNPMLKVVAPKTGKRLPVYLQAAEIDHLFEGIAFGDDYAGRRDRLLLELLYTTGMRRAELIGLCVENIDLSTLQIKVLGKGNKERLIPFGAPLAKHIKAFMLIRAANFPDNAHPELLLTDKGKPFYPKAIYNIVKRYLSAVSTVEQRSPHTLRHTFATHLSNNGADLNAIKALLGHSSLAATQVYTHNSIEKLKQIYQQAHPKAKSD
jgi:integrase/recombinase XerC